MAIQVQIRGASIAQREDGEVVLAITLDTTNDAFPGDETILAVSYPVTMTAVDIRSAINDAVTLLWIARETPQWTA